MKKILFIIVAFIGVMGFSQTLKPMTWSGIITDNSGNPLENTNVNLKFSIYLDDIETYSETQSQTTNEKGFVTANIGSGTTVLGNYDSTLLNTLNSKLKIEVDTGSGFVTLQDGPISAVPMAKASEVAYVLSYEDNEVNVTSSDITFTRDNQLVGRFSDDGFRLASLEDFSETNNVPVEVTPSGILQRGIPEATEKYLNISGSAFAAGTGFYFDTDGLTNNTDNTVMLFRQYKSISLPHGATIKNIKVFLIDNNNTSYLSVGLYTHSNNFFPIASLTTEGVSSSANTQTLDSGVINHTVNNLDRGYFLVLYSPTWFADDTLKLDRILITYEE